ncbi:c-type cytochrome [Endozoicomonadaceae bacterium StTr2]
MKKELTKFMAGVCLVGMMSPMAFAAQAPSSPVMFEKESDEVEYREHLMDLIGNYTGAIGAVVKKKFPYETDEQKKKVEEVTAAIAALASQASIGFERELSAGTKASPDIWKKKPEFMQKMNDMVTQARNLHTAAGTGNYDKLKAAFGDYAATCKACHKAFKE